MSSQRQLQRVTNFRDVGVSTGGAASLKPGKLFRSSYIDKATKGDRQYLHNSLGISTLINLDGPPTDYLVQDPKTAEYKQRFADRINSYNVLDVTVHEIDIRSIAYRKEVLKKVPWKEKAKGFGYFFISNLDEFKRIYARAVDKSYNPSRAAREYLALSKPQIKAIFEALAQEDVCPVLIYGPSTAFIICLVLMLLGVPDANISHDFDLSESNVPDILEDVNSKRRDLGMEELKVLEHPQGYTGELVSHIEREYQGIDVYLASTGLTHQQLQRVKDNLRGVAGGSEKLVDLGNEFGL